MTLTASTIINDVAATLHDSGFVRWTQAWHLRNLTKVTRELVSLRPDALAVTEAVQLAAGMTRQSIPADKSTLISVHRNQGSDGTTVGPQITLTTRESLDNAIPDWHNTAGDTMVLHYIFDDRTPREFYVYPPTHAATAVYVLMSCAKVPDELTDMTDELEVDANFEAAITDNLLAFAWGVNHASSADREKSREAKSRFYLSIGEVEKAKLLYSPNANEETDK